MTLQEHVEMHWSNTNADVKVAGWVKQLKDNENEVREAVKKFHEWQPLQIYLSVTRAINPRISFSVRYQGQEVASLNVHNDKVQLVITCETAKSNMKYFGISKKGEFPWRGPEAAEFRKHFKNLDPFNQKGRIQEHSIESEFLMQMADDTAKKFDGTLKNIQPVLWAGCPFQFPLPISGSRGVPKPTEGNIDILARCGTGKGTRISIWELKKPGTTAKAIEQVYIYSVTLIKMLRSASGAEWYQDIIGFKGKVPDKLTIESVIAVRIKSQRQQDIFTSKIQKFKSENSLNIGNDTIKTCVAYYEENPLRFQYGVQEI